MLGIWRAVGLLYLFHGRPKPHIGIVAFLNLLTHCSMATVEDMALGFRAKWHLIMQAPSIVIPVFITSG
ncbi:hypothetical protein D3C75_1344340 [compost metagenome]